MVNVAGSNKTFLVRYFCPISTKFGVSRHIFIKVPSAKFYGKNVQSKFLWHTRTDMLLWQN